MKIFLFFITLILVQPAFAWKPTTHVYLGKEALSEIDLNNNIPFYNVDYENKEKLGIIGRFEANHELVNLLKRESDSFYAGILGPDAYPDLPTGQTRIHVSCPDGAVELEKSNNYCPASSLHNHQIITDDWLSHIWENAQKSGQDDVKAFAFGYMVHAAGDMFMHTFVNYFAGGEFSTFSDNGLRHTIIESYVGKRTPALFDSGEEYDIELTNNVSKFIFDFLVNATSDSDLHNKLLVELPWDHTLSNLHTTVSIPRHFSSLRNMLEVNIKKYDNTVEAFNDKLLPLTEALSDCVDRAIDNKLLNNCNPLTMVDLSLQIGAIHLQKDIYILPRFVFNAYIRNWKNDINEGLEAWPAFSHDVGKILLFNKENKFDKEALADRWEVYRNSHFVKMMGGTVIASEVLTQYSELMEQLYPADIMAIVDTLKTTGRNAFLDIIIRVLTRNEVSREEFVEYIENPETKINTVINNTDVAFNNIPIAIDIQGLNQLIGLQDEAYNNPDEKFDNDSFSPAFNTITMIKLMLLSDDGIVALYNTLCNQSLTCNETIETSPSPNAMLGFIRTLDGQNEWNNHDKKMLIASECGLYQQIFMHQTGEEIETDENCVRIYTPVLVDLNIVVEQPEITAGGEFDQLPEISMSHLDPDVQIYYSINDADTSHIPSNDPADSRSHLYIKPFVLQAPFTEVKSQVIRAVAFKDGALPSQVVEEAFLITVFQSKPSFFPVLIDHQGSVTININADAGAALFYTINGTTPDYTSTPYTGAFTLSPGQYSVKAIAYQLGIPQSNISTKQYNVWNADGSDNLAEPRLTPNGSINVVDSIDLMMKSFDEGADIRYTKVNSSVYIEPTVTSTRYLSPITLLQGNWFIAVKAFDPSGVLGPSTTKFINITVSSAVGFVVKPVIEPNGGTFNNKINIILSGETSPDNIGNPQRYYTLDGTNPQAFPHLKANYNRFNGLNLNKSSMLKVQALQTGFSVSEVATASFEFVAASPVLSPKHGTFNESVEIVLESITLNSKIYYTIDGSEPMEDSMLYDAPFTLTESTTVRSKAIRFGYSDSVVVMGNFIVKQATQPEFVKHPESVNAYVGQDIILSALVSSFPLSSFQWFKDDALLESETAQRLFINNVQVSDNAGYKLIATNSAGATESNIATLMVAELPSTPLINQQPVDVELLIGQTLELQVNVTSVAEQLLYQWYFEGAIIAGGNSPNLMVNNVNVEHAGVYWVVVSNVAGFIKSDSAVVNIKVVTPIIRPVDYELPPNIISQPRSINIISGEILNLTVIVDAFPLPTYLWFFNQGPINDQLGPTLVIDSSTSENSGEYFVVVRNSQGIQVSDFVTVTVTEKKPSNSPVGGEEEENTSGSALSPMFLLPWIILFFGMRVFRYVWLKSEIISPSS